MDKTLAKADDTAFRETRRRQSSTSPPVGVIGVARVGVIGRLNRLTRASVLDRYAQLINETTLLRAVVLEMTGQPAAVATRLVRRSPPMSAAFIPGLAAPAAADVQHRVAQAGGPLTVSFTDAVTTAHAAAVLAALNYVSVPVYRARALRWSTRPPVRFSGRS